MVAGEALAYKLYSLFNQILNIKYIEQRCRMGDVYVTSGLVVKIEFESIG